jgi:S-formylglutathione hydrolase FrmB
MDNVPMIVAMPDAHRSFYVNNPAPGGSPYEDHIIKDVIGFVDTTFRTIPQRGARAVAGMSMGGYGAMMLGFKHADLFSVACSHSGAVGAFHHPRPEVPLLQDLSSAIDISQYDCFALAQKQKERPAGELAIRIDCGDKDFLLQDNRDFHAHLEQLGIAHSYAEFPGDHNWAYWDVHIQDTIRFIRQKLPALQGQE